MTNRIFYVLLFISFTLGINTVKSQGLYDINTIQEIELQFSQSNWDYLLDSAKNSTEGYVMASWVKINGVQFDSVGVKYKGNSSYDSAYVKNPVHISLDKYKSQKYLGYEDIKLSNGYGDPSCIREVLAYAILNNYMHAPLSNFAKLTINGTYIGLYSSSESIDSKFLGDHFFSNNNTFVKCNPTGAPTPAQKSNFLYTTADSSGYTAFYELKSDTGWHEFIDLCNTVTNIPANLSTALDVDRAIWMLAFNNTLVNLDSYNGVYAQNHYAYKDHTGHFNPIIWDLNMCFGSFPYAGSGTVGIGFKTNTELKQLSPFNHELETRWPLINDILADTTSRRKYLAHMKTILTEQLVSGQYQTLAAQYQTLIDNAVSTDVHKFFTYANFQGGMNTDVAFGSFTVPGISNIMEARKTYLLSLTEFSASEPVIQTPVFSNTAPAYNSTVHVSVNITNALSSNPYIGYRFDKKNKFMKLPLFDDGSHNDGAAGDLVFGNSFTMSGADMQYYVYAENSSIGKFLPARAEHEYLHLYAVHTTPNPGDLVINELLAENVGGERDEYNDTEDWIELYNTTNQVLDLSGMYLSNVYSNPLKWTVPANTFILPNGYITLWADDDSIQHVLHTNFNLDKDTGHLIISNAAQVMLDSISFTGQTSAASYGRYPNGSGSFILMGTTFGYENNNFPLGLTSPSTLKEELLVYPNPANQQITIQWKPSSKITEVEIYDMFGHKITSLPYSPTIICSTTFLANGLYFIKAGGSTAQFVVQH